MWNILVVDDNFVNRQLLTHMLADCAVCDGAVNGKEAIEAFNNALANKEPYHLILLDIAMPEMNGMEVLELLREHERKAGIELGDGVPVIMVTAFKEPVIKAFDCGCDDYILKPVDPKVLREKITAKLGPCPKTDKNKE